MDQAYMHDRYRRSRFVCCALISRRQEKQLEFLLIREGVGPDTDKWNIPTGGHTPGETLEQTVIRETKEETGGTFQPKALLCLSSVIRNDLAEHDILPHIIRAVFVGNYQEPEAGHELGWDIKAIGWFSEEQIRSGEIVLRSPDIPRLIDLHHRGPRYPLGIIIHTATEPK